MRFKEIMNTRLKIRPFAISIFAIPFFLLGLGTASADSQGFKLLEDLENAFVSLADKVRPAVVSLSPYVPPSPSVRRLDVPPPKGLSNFGPAE